MACDLSLRLTGRSLPSFAGWSGYPSIAALSINPWIDANGMDRPCSCPERPTESVRGLCSTRSTCHDLQERRRRCPHNWYRYRQEHAARRRAGPGAAPAQKKHDRGWGRRGMRYPASEKLEIIRLVERAHLPARRTLETLGILPSTFYRWYDRYLAGGPEALEDKPSIPRRVWNRIPDGVRKRI